MNCPRCAYTDLVKNGFVNRTQRYKCKACQYILDARHAEVSLQTKAARCAVICSWHFNECYLQIVRYPGLFCAKMDRDVRENVCAKI